jgi:WD40 repeat protein
MPKIFVSHRRRSSRGVKGATGRIYDRLVSRYGKDSIFIDIDNMKPGVDFRKQISQVLQECDILIAIVGPKWLGSPKAGSANIHNENDWVRLEIETALNRDIPIIPTLVEGAQMPSAGDLPDSLRDFAYRHATTVSDDQDFHIHVDRLIQSIDEKFKLTPSKQGRFQVRPSKPLLFAASAAAAVLLLSAGAIWHPILLPRTAEQPLVGLDSSPSPLSVPAVAAKPPEIRSDSETLTAARQPDAATPLAGKNADAKAELPRVDLKPELARPDPIKPEPKKPDFANLNVAGNAREVGPLVTITDSKPPDALVLGQSCAARIGRVTADGRGLGGPFIPLSIKPSFSDAKDIRSIAVSPRGNEIATAGDDGWIRVWDASSFKLLRTLKGHDGRIYSIDYWIDGKLLASAGWDGKVKVWEVLSGNPSPIYTFEVTNEAQNTPVKLYSVAFLRGPALKYLAAGGDDGYIRIWDWQHKQLARTRLDHKDPDISKTAIRSLSYAPNATGEFVTAGYDGKIRFYRSGNAIDTKDAYVKKTLRVAYSPDSSRVVSAGADLVGDPGSLKIWDLKADIVKTLSGHKDYIVSANWSPDGTRLVSGGGGRDKSVYLWDAAAGRILSGFLGHQGDVEAVAFYPGGSRLISASEDKTIKIWDIASRKEILTAIGFGEKDYLLYTPEGCYSGSSGIEARLSLAAGDRPATLNVENRRLMFMPEGFGSLLSGR